MQAYSTVTQKGQITIPSAIRSLVGIVSYDRVGIVVEKGKIIITPQRTILDMSPIAVAPKRKSALKAREYMAKNYQFR